MINGITYYKLNEDYHWSKEDVTKNDSLTGGEIDNNFNVLEGRDISSIKVSEDKKKLQIVLLNKSIIESPNIFNDFAEILNFSYDDENGILTVDINDGEQIIEVEGFTTLYDVAEMLNKYCVNTDGTLNGNGTLFSPLSISRAHRTGTVRPIICLIDEGDLENLPEPPMVGDRYLTTESINSDGRFYNFNGLVDVMKALDEEDNGWQVATKADWDGILNALEPDEACRTHADVRGSISLGRMANANLADSSSGFNLKYCGYAYNEGHDQTHLTFVGTRTAYWTATTIGNKPIDYETSRNAYTKRFTKDEYGVYQDIIDNSVFYSIRLVKDCSENEVVTAANILGSTYPVQVMRTASGKMKMWTTVNFNYDTEDDNSIEGSEETITQFYVNEWDGNQWLKSTIDDYIMFFMKNTEEICYTKDGDIVSLNNTDLNLPTLTFTKAFSGEVLNVYDPNKKEDVNVEIPTSDDLATINGEPIVNGGNDIVVDGTVTHWFGTQAEYDAISAQGYTFAEGIEYLYDENGEAYNEEEFTQIYDAEATYYKDQELTEIAELNVDFFPPYNPNTIYHVAKDRPTETLVFTYIDQETGEERQKTITFYVKEEE